MAEVKEWVVVVGATGAFGSVMVERFLARGLGVVAVARSETTLQALASANTGLKPCVADIGQDSSIEAIRAALPGPVRMVVHGPGVSVGGGVLNIDTSALVDAVNIKVGGLLRLVRAVDAHLQTDSRLVAIGGHYGFEPTAYAAAAGVANAALVNVIRQLSLAYGERSITAHLVAPGPADTERLRRVAADRARLNNTTVEEVMASMLNESSIHAFTEPGQVAWALEMLLAPEASAMTGSSLMLDAGRRRGLP
ncbi:SDR family oxidoreductase [Dechloromonas sp. CZR5]|jgi:NADP-dependent 3-hydroxy acid dehydrogenase YdfG|uniref:SDR family oxidoreductase n=1 Tax=Dechloromonas sp. CZR5 TaxID=2608630 RepID=UPI00123DEF4A|nr:SDR family oxidoreductase [Dechloromonas sp. CZR5]